MYEFGSSSPSQTDKGRQKRQPPRRNCASQQRASPMLASVALFAVSAAAPPQALLDSGGQLAARLADPAIATNTAALADLDEAKCPGHPNIHASSLRCQEKTAKASQATPDKAAAAEPDKAAKAGAEAKCPGHPNIHASSPRCQEETAKAAQATPDKAAAAKPDKAAAAKPDKAAAAKPDKVAKAGAGPTLSTKRPPQPFGTQGGEVGDDCFAACDTTAGKCFDEKEGRGFCGLVGEVSWSGSCCKAGAVGALLVPGEGVKVLQSPDCGDRGCEDKHCCVKDPPGAISDEDIEEKAADP